MTAQIAPREVEAANQVVVGLIEAVGQLGDNELFVSGWSRERPAPGAAVLAVGKRQTIEGRIWTAWSDRPDVGPHTGYAGVIELARPIDAAELHSVRLGGARGFALYEGRNILDRPQAIALLRAGLPAALVEGQRQRLEQVATRFDGTDTISGAIQPVRVGIDDCVVLPGETLLVSGWLFDPEATVETVWVARDSARLRIDVDWVSQARPDVAASFAAEPRFALYRPAHVAHGFAALASGIATIKDLRLTVVTRDGTALHVPLSARQGAPLPLLRGFLARLDPNLPTSLDIADRQIAPVLAALDPPRLQLLRHTLGPPHLDAPLTLVIGCFGDGADLPMLLAMLAADPAVRAIPLVVAGGTRELASLAGQIERAAQAYGLTIGLAHGDGIGDHLDALTIGAAAASGPLLCLLAADRLPRGQGWLTALQSASRATPDAVILPAMLDGSLYGPHGGQRARLASDPGCCIIDRSAFLDAAGSAANRLDREGKNQALLDHLATAGVSARIVETVEVLTVSQTPPAAALARRADARATQLKILSRRLSQ
ncbi:hypothetical protein [uncultured Devosia sp.]|uniref:hypothetical protein n=1 Tax=uncultured Devosia sp. TaxID=211434 RepID=UPI0035CB5BEC